MQKMKQLGDSGKFLSYVPFTRFTLRSTNDKMLRFSKTLGDTREISKALREDRRFLTEMIVNASDLQSFKVKL